MLGFVPAPAISPAGLEFRDVQCGPTATMVDFVPGDDTASVELDLSTAVHLLHDDEAALRLPWSLRDARAPQP